jgi:hypothetical protein
MSDTYYGLLSVASLTGLIVSMFGPLGSIVGLSMIGLSNGLAVSMACKQKCQHTSPPEDEES